MEDHVIKYVKDYRFLYDPREKDYKNMTKKHQVWLNLAVELNSDVQTVKRKWKSLRDSFFREHAKRENPITSTGAIGKCSWKWYNQLRFLNSARVKSVSKLNVAEETCSDRSTSCSPQLIPLQDTQLIEEDDEITRENQLEPVTKVEVAEETFSERSFFCSPQPTATKRRQLTVEDGLSESAHSENKKIRKTTHKVLEKPPGKAYHFFMSVAELVNDSNLTNTEFIDLQVTILEIIKTFIKN